jgi:hypothetical protein
MWVVKKCFKAFAFTGNTHQTEATEGYEAARQAFTNKFQEQLDIKPLTTTSRQLKEMELHFQLINGMDGTETCGTAQFQRVPFS